MKASEWREKKRNKRLGVIEQDALIAALEAAEKELDLVDTALARRQALDDCPTRYDKILRACTTASRAEKAEADRDAISKEWNDWASSHSAWIAERAVLLAERDALKAELTDYVLLFGHEHVGRFLSQVALDETIARIRARREKEVTP